MKKANSGSNPASKPRGLKFETLENRTALSADPVLMSVCCGNAAPNKKASSRRLQRTILFLVGPIPLNGFYDFVDKSGGDFHSDANVDEEAQKRLRGIGLCRALILPPKSRRRSNRLTVCVLTRRGSDRIFRYYDNRNSLLRNSLVNDAIKLNSYPKDSIKVFVMWSRYSDSPTGL